MINPTFGSIKHQKDIHNIKSNLIKKYQPLPSTFKEIREFRENGKTQHPIASKRFQNQQNTFTNAFNQPIFTKHPRKNLVKVEKSNKKPHLYKSPNHKAFQIASVTSKEKFLQQSNYVTKLTFTRNDDSSSIMTPSLSKTNRSFINQDTFNGSFLTEKQNNLRDSENGSVSASSKNSFNDSFQLYQQDLSYQQQDRSLRQRTDFVNSSVELTRQTSALNRTINQFGKNQRQIGTMKKSNIYYAKNNVQNRILCDDLQKKSVTSSVSSMKFSQKFRHYKRHSQGLYQIKKSKSLALNDFIRLRQIGEGKYGKVFLAKHLQSGFICALKQVSKKMIKQQNLQEPFLREVKIQFYLNHPNIVKLYGVFNDENNVYLIMEYCSGSHLLKLIKERQHFLQNQRIQILSNIYEAVAYIHCHGIIHRDLKPQNIVIQNGVYKLCDFGWAAYSCGDTRTTFCGTPLYVCPEVLKGEEYNEKADIWGLGVITYQLTFGRVPFSIINQSDLMKIIKDPVYFPIWNQTSQKLMMFIRRMLSKRSEERPTLNQILASDLFTNNLMAQNQILKTQVQRVF